MGKKKGENTKPETTKKLMVIENKVRITAASCMGDIDHAGSFYIMYFVDMNIIVIFKGDQSKRKKTELPWLLIRIKDLINVNFRIPQQLTSIIFNFLDGDKSISFKFSDENIKNELGDRIKKLLKTPEKFNLGEENSYTDTEIKYKIAKMLESVNFEAVKDNYDYRKLLDFDYLFKYNQIYNNKSSRHSYLFNRLFMGRVAVINKKHKRLGKPISICKIDSYIDGLSSSSFMFCIFLLSRGVYNLKKHTLADYFTLVMDITDSGYLESWMEFDRIYMFNYKRLKKEVANEMIPYDFILDTIYIENIELIEAKKFCIKVEYAQTVDYLIFENVIEAWKFYNYIRTLYLNVKERQNSLCYDIIINLRILFDDTRFSSMESVFMVLVDNYNMNYNKKLANRSKLIMDEAHINFKAITEFYNIFLISFYSLADCSDSFHKLKVFINKFHELFFDHIKEILRNPYSEVSLEAEDHI